MSSFQINLDFNATAGLDSRVSDAIHREGLDFLNPSSIHYGGQRARSVLESSRDRVRSLVGIERGGIVIFTSGATEANNTALLMPFWNYLSVNERKSSITPSLVITSLEHPSVLEAAHRLKEFGVDVRILNPQKDGRVSPGMFADAVDGHTKMVSVMSVNNETGQVLPVKEILRAVKERNSKVLVHTDAVQSLGKLDLSFEDFEVDMMSISGHKIGAISGIGALICRKGVPIDPLIVGGPQEVRRRAGTENVIGALSLGLACSLIDGKVKARREMMSRNRTIILDLITSALPEAVIHFTHLENVGNTLSVRFPGVMTSDLVVALDLEGVFVSSGSACASGKIEPSHVLQSMGLCERDARETIRISVGSYYESGALEEAVIRIARCVKRMRESSI